MASDSEYDPRVDPPGAISDQNREEAHSGHREDETHPEPRTRGRRVREVEGLPRPPRRQPDQPPESPD